MVQDFRLSPLPTYTARLLRQLSHLDVGHPLLGRRTRARCYIALLIPVLGWRKLCQTLFTFTAWQA